MSLSWTVSRVDGLEALVLDAAKIRLVVLPELGAKTLSLIWQPTGHEYLWRHPGRPLQRAAYGADFEAGDISGWDECFPTIGACFYPEEPWRGVSVPDHGELWSLTWEWGIEGNVCRMWTDGVRFPYRFERVIAFADDNRLDLTYAVENRAPFPLHAIWSMHPFFRVSDDTRILIPDAREVMVEVSRGARLGGFLARQPWPEATDREGNTVDLSLVGPRDPRFMEKVFTGPLKIGAAALYTPSHDHYLAFAFNPEVIPYVGVAMMRGGWPGHGEPSYSVILEPCTGWPDRLDIALSRGATMTIPPRSTAQWTVAVTLGTGYSELAAAFVPGD